MKLLFSTQLLFESHGIRRKMDLHPRKSSQVLCSSCQTIRCTVCLIQMLNRVLNVTIQKLILYWSVMLREDTNFGKHKLSRYTYMSFSGTHFTTSGTHFTASATLLETECDQPSLCKYYVKTYPCLCTDMILTLHLTNKIKLCQESTGANKTAKSFLLCLKHFCTVQIDSISVMV